ncbi:bactofilin family protein [Jannaschia pohangensis]|uniref:Protein CcmA, bactofilin family n=1 Tax=Jannaschia pohangensis TaxID=390807 RepID=A0A1I3GZR5_9RHOB|nr:polymer-forming cytoskeletal protein [Jannaschia pohangensis]SFI28807.1 hypothetical protein SAMN04488095_0394 [Jannaschia pohangensis]
MTRRFLAALLLAAVVLPATADQFDMQSGGDRLISGTRPEATGTAPRDLLISGAQIVMRADVEDDLFAAGFAIDVEGPTGGDVTAAGARVRLDADVGADATVTGGIVTLDDASDVIGNARIFAGSATISGKVGGSLVAMASEIRLNGQITGDVRIQANALSFGPDARIDGRLVMALPEEMDVPTSVAPSVRVSYEYIDAEGWRDFDELAWDNMPEAPTAMAIGGGYLLGLAFLLVTGAAFLALMPDGVANMRRMALAQPGITMLVGGVGFSTLVGLIPVSAMSVIGLPLLPIAILAVILAWGLGYLLGAYVLAMAIGQAAGLGDSPTLPVRLAILACAITGMALLNFIPFVGWIVNLALVFLGVGAMTKGVLRRLMPDVDTAAHDEMMKSQVGD